MKRKIVICLLVVLAAAGCFFAFRPDESFFPRDPDWHNIKKGWFTADGMYSTFEDELGSASEIVVATYQKSEAASPWYDVHTFKVKKTLKGIEQKIITMQEYPGDYAMGDERGMASWRTGTLEYEKGKEYILVLSRRMLWFKEEYAHTLLGEIFLPVSDLSASTIFNDPLEEHSDVTLSEWIDLDAAIEYIEAHKGEEAEELPYRFTDSSRLSKMLSLASFVCRVKVEKVEGGHLKGEYKDAYCKVQEYLYLDEDLDKWKDLTVHAPPGALEEGGEYLMILGGEPGRYNYMVSEHAALPVDKLPKLLRALKKAGLRSE